MTETEDGAVVLDERSGTYWQLNSSGSLILSILLAGGTEEQAADALAAKYPVDPGRALADVRALIESLRAARLVRS
ncbi:MAG TPA: lasso peptide biosynthesis PqqD family chaperone [Natronosporangium sp.]